MSRNRLESICWLLVCFVVIFFLSLSFVINVSVVIFYDIVNLVTLSLMENLFECIKLYEEIKQYINVCVRECLEKRMATMRPTMSGGNFEKT